MENQPTDEKSFPDHSFWETSFANKQTGWDRGEVHPALTDWLSSGQLSRCRIAVPGCGNGYEVVRLAERGFDVTGIDFVEQPVNQLRKRLAGFDSHARVVHANIFDFSPAEPFDAVYEQTCLCALAPGKRAEYEAKVFQWLRAHGKLYVLFMQTGNRDSGPPFNCDLNDMKTLFHADRWSWKQEERRRYDHPRGAGYELAAELTRKASRNGG